MKQFQIVSLSLLVMILGSACASNRDFAQSIQKETGVPVQLDAGNEDSCLNAQLDAWVREYQMLNEQKKLEVKSELSRYNQITLKATQESGSMEGSQIDLNLRIESCLTRVIEGELYRPGPYDRCFRTYEGLCRRLVTINDCITLRNESRTVSNTIHKEGKSPVVLVSRANALTVQVQRFSNNAFRKRYRTSNAYLFDHVTSESDLNYGDVHLLARESSGSDYCASKISLAELLRN